MKLLLKLFYFIFVFGCSQLNAQKYLDSVYYFTQNDRASLLLEDSTFVIVGGSNVNVNYQDIHRLKFDGTILMSNSFTSNEDKYHCYKCLEENNQVLYYASNVLGNSFNEGIRFIKYNKSTLDTITTSKHFGNYFLHDLKFDSDSSFIVAGLHIHYDTISIPHVVYFEPYVARVDTNFTVLWEYIEPKSDNILTNGPSIDDIEIVGHSIYCTGSSAYVDGRNQYAFILKLNSISGLSEYYREYTNSQFGYAGMYVKLRQDGNFQYTMSRNTKSSLGNQQLLIGIMDSLGNILQERSIHRPDRYHMTEDLIELMDGNYYTAGNTYFYDRYGFGFKFSPNLDSIFYIDLIHGDLGDRNQIETFVETKDSMILHSGYFIDNVNPIETEVVQWFKLIDKQGCDTTNCGIGFYEYHLGELQMYPNPTYGQFVIRSNDQSFFDTPTHLKIYNLNGALVFNQQYQANEPIHVNLQKTAGLYQCILTDLKGNVLGMEKLVVIE